MDLELNLTYNCDIIVTLLESLILGTLASIKVHVYVSFMANRPKHSTVSWERFIMLTLNKMKYIRHIL